MSGNRGPTCDEDDCENPASSVCPTCSLMLCADHDLARCDQCGHTMEAL